MECFKFMNINVLLVQFQRDVEVINLFIYLGMHTHSKN